MAIFGGAEPTLKAIRAWESQWGVPYGSPLGTKPQGSTGQSSAASNIKFGPGQGAVFTPDPTVGGDWTHTRADIPLFRPAASGASAMPAPKPAMGQTAMPSMPTAPNTATGLSMPSMPAAAPAMPAATGMGASPRPPMPPQGMAPPMPMQGQASQMGWQRPDFRGQGQAWGRGFEGGAMSNPAFTAWRDQQGQQPRPQRPQMPQRSPRDLLADILAGR